MTVQISKPAFNLREALTSLKRKIGLKGAEIMKAETVDDVYGVIGTNRNWIINGNTRVSQRGDYTSAGIDFPINSYFVDRWKSDRNITCELRHMTSGMPTASCSNRSIKLTATATSSSVYMGAIQYIEDYALLSGKTITLSAWVKSNTAKANLSWWDGDTTRGAIFSKGHSGNGTWEKLTATGVVTASPTQGRVGLYLTNVDKNLSVTTITSGDYIEFTDVQLELGSVATPFEHRPYATELALCQRYYEDSSNEPYSGSILPKSGLYESLQKQFLVEKRASPTMTSVAQAYWPDGGGSMTISSFGLVSSKRGFYIATGNGASWVFSQSWKASAEL